MIEGTVKLNGLWYNLASKIMGTYHSRMPGKVNTGPDEFDKENFLSNWIISDQRGGIGVDEMDESVHADRSWWTNCITDYDGHMTLPRLATAIETDLTLTAPTGHVDGASAWTSEASAYDGNVATKATEAAVPATSWSEFLEFTIASTNCWGARAYITIAGSSASTKIDVDVYYGGAWNHVIEQVYAGATSWNYAELTAVQAVTACRVRIYNPTAGAADCYIHDVDFFMESATTSTVFHFANFNSQLYLSQDDTLTRLNSARNAFIPIAVFAANITALLIGPNGSLLVYLGDTTVYQYMTATTEIFTATNVNDATTGILWDSKAWKMDADGNWWHSTDADSSATPTWTSKAGITDVPAQIERLGIGIDANGNPIIYCSTNTWLKVYDFTNNKWINTAVKLYGNQYHGKGFVYWNNAHYLSYGIGVKSYTVGTTGTLSDVGLNRDGGLPAEYNGVIPRLIDGGDQLFALVDASLVTGTQQSGLYAFTGQAWQCWWADASNDGAMNDAIVSSARSAYAVYFDCGGAIYYIDIPQGLSNPKYLTGTQTYATAGIYLSPWFDGGNQAFQKLVKAVVSYTKLVTTTETIIIKYRLNKTNTDRDTGWTTLATFDTTAENGAIVNQIASGAGLAFNTFQFRLDFARGSTTTLSPDMLALVMGHRLITQGNWSWTMTLAIDNSHNTSPATKWANLESAIESRTDVPFIYRFDPDETHYVSFLSPQEIMAAGKEFDGHIQITVLEPWLP